MAKAHRITKKNTQIVEWPRGPGAACEDAREKEMAWWVSRGKQQIPGGERLKSMSKLPHKRGQVRMLVIACRKSKLTQNEEIITGRGRQELPVSVSKEIAGPGKSPPPDRQDYGASWKCCTKASM